MNKPDTKAIQEELARPILLGAKERLPGEVYWQVRKLQELCDYIDQLPDPWKDHDMLVKAAADRVRAEIREFVQKEYEFSGGSKNVYEILDFIDNGPKKPTATEIIDNTVAAWGLNGKRTNLSRDIHQQLMQAGYLPDTETVQVSE